MAATKELLPGLDGDTAPARLFRVRYLDTIIRETFVQAHDENEAEDIVEAEIADARLHHAIDACHDHMRTERVTSIGHRPPCFECGHSGQ